MLLAFAVAEPTSNLLDLALQAAKPLGKALSLEVRQYAWDPVTGANPLFVHASDIYDALLSQQALLERETKVTRCSPPACGTLLSLSLSLSLSPACRPFYTHAHAHAHAHAHTHTHTHTHAYSRTQLSHTHEFLHV
jgi:hypothetical protein